MTNDHVLGRKRGETTLFGEFEGHPWKSNSGSTLSGPGHHPADVEYAAIVALGNKFWPRKFLDVAVASRASDVTPVGTTRSDAPLLSDAPPSDVTALSNGTLLKTAPSEVTQPSVTTALSGTLPSDGTSSFCPPPSVKLFTCERDLFC
ncbi:hypothetical protein M427DRAFT_266511 [Gonapodya prolifera JEL478]|uniref:Uncharacterized protein n=1 Tax=Gonapodya prolifera (strain JEL478) TaxID=1344416 RepID=A0A138ZXC6_GONPJ|nr:hypothetical protein M427DRAFT_266511 [Gonapodya prolifera JEL478]|eukprot:KXS08945.1 hypothetical protein M427DRAFT_266511 [Gonapodya prolifera JEL478]